MAETKTTPGGNRSAAAKKAAATRARRSARVKQVEQSARGYFDAVVARDPEAMAGFWSADGVEDIVPLGVFRGPDGVRSLFTELFTAFPDAEMRVVRMLADDTTAAVEWRMTGTFTGGPFQGVQPTGRGVDVRGTDLVEVGEDGLIVRNTAYYDGMAFARQIGLMPPQDSGAERTMKNAFNAVTKVRQALADRSGGT